MSQYTSMNNVKTRLHERCGGWGRCRIHLPAPRLTLNRKDGNAHRLRLVPTVRIANRVLKSNVHTVFRNETYETRRYRCESIAHSVAADRAGRLSGTVVPISGRQLNAVVAEVLLRRSCHHAEAANEQGECDRQKDEAVQQAYRLPVEKEPLSGSLPRLMARNTVLKNVTIMYAGTSASTTTARIVEIAPCVSGHPSAPRACWMRSLGSFSSETT